MSFLNDDLNDSALFCKSITQKRKAPSSGSNPKTSKQLRLNFPSKTTEDNQGKSDNSSQEDSQGSSEKGNGYLSSYFQPRKSMNDCPLCLKSFKTDSAYSTHMKQCAKTRKMTTQQLLMALELQKKQIQERRDLGLHFQDIPADKKTSSKRKEDKDLDSYDLALGLAISKSLSTSESKGETVPETQSTLKQFKITSNLPVGPTKKRNWNKKSTLKERTAEERQRIIIEKVAVVLLDEEKESEPERTSGSNSASQSDQLIHLMKMGQQLWKLGENDEKRLWYVDGIKSLVLPTEEREEGEPDPVSEDELKIEISKLNLPQEEIHENWRKMINNSKLSDVTGRTKDSRDFHLHSVVLYARRPEILKKDLESVLEKFDLSTVVVFLEYLYCGTLNGLVKKEIKNLCDLATEVNYGELVTILNFLENNLSKACEISGGRKEEKEEEGGGRVGVESKDAGFFEEKDLFVEEVVDLTQSSHESVVEEKQEVESENESNAEKSYWSFMQHEKEREKLEWEGNGGNSVRIEEREGKEASLEEEVEGTRSRLEEEGTEWRNGVQVEKIGRVERMESDDSATRDLDEAFKMKSTRRSTECIVLSSGSESRDSKNPEELQERLRTPSPARVDYEIPYFDPYDNFNWFSEEQFSPVNAESQSLITGDVSTDSLKPGDGGSRKTPREEESVAREEREKISSGYCSTPVTMRHSLKVSQLPIRQMAFAGVRGVNSKRFEQVKSGRKEGSESRRKRRSNLSGSRILRRSLDLQFKARGGKKSSVSRKSVKRKEKDFAEVLTDSILNELSKSSTPLTAKNFVEITPVPNGDEFGESVTPSPNYSKMEEALLKEQLSKYGLKKNLGKNKARKILRYIYEELHPLYNTKTGKIVKVLSSDTPKLNKKAKPKGRNTKPKQCKNRRAENKKETNLSSPKESIPSDGSSDTLEGPRDDETDGSDSESLSETLTQTAPSNALDLPSAFVEFLENNPEYHQKVLTYEPIWLEELQKKLKESFKKHFKIADLMDYLDQKCITFRSAAQLKNTQRKNEKRKKITEKAKALPDT